MTPLRRTIAALVVALAVAFPAGAYLPPASAILKRVSQRRADLAVATVEVRGTLTFFGDAARHVSAATGLPLSGPELAAPAILLVKLPWRCRLELAPGGVTPANRPTVSARGARIRGMQNAPQARALLEGVCALLGEQGGGGAEPERSIALRLASQGVALNEVALGRLDGRVAWVLGGRPPRPQAWVDKQSLQLIRLVAPLAGAERDVRLLDFGSPVGGDAFPRAVELWSGRDLDARFVTEKLMLNPKISDALF
ncbi:MAG: hypothetical protein A2V77_16265 [Anaeromyxobacter sp. RBG_16_69_14]|nr:MAG: hypothetical protein A2V77_16265 [Anaeromyxobacter sp. RBG_16_69_14]